MTARTLPALIPCALALLSVHALAAGFSFKDQVGEHLTILHDGKPIARYMYAHDISSKERRAETYKPYLHVFDASGKELITKGPGGNFPHHRGIYIGWSKLNVAGKSYDRWHMNNGDQVHRKFTEQLADASSATFTSLVDWTLTGAEKPILVEERTLSFLTPPKPAYALIDMLSKLKAVGGETKLDGDREHAGLQFRAAAEVVPAETVHVFPRENADPVKDKVYPWMGQTYTVHGKRFSVVYLNHPSNPQDAETSAYRDYGRFGVFFRDTIPADGERTIRARFLIAEGEMPSAEVIQKAYNDFADKSDPVPQITVKKVKASAPPKPKATPKPAP